MIREDFLHYLWKYKLFETTNLNSSLQEEIVIINSGVHNFNSGPDFFNAKIRISGQIWVGNVEIHIKSSDWYVHNHETDTSYDNVILHVVWEDDISIFRKDNTIIPTLSIKNYISKKLLNSYQHLFSKQKAWINCEKNTQTISKFTLDNWKENLFIERLENKSKFILDLLKKSNNDWEAVLFKILAKNFGLKVNGDAFFNMANSFDFSVFKKNQSKVENLEALLFGQSSLLGGNYEDVYLTTLKKEYQFIKNKFKLDAIPNNEIVFFRLRPSNFPTIRLSQLANLYASHSNLFSKIMSINKMEGFYAIFNCKASSYWETHYSFNKTSNKSVKKTTKSFVDLLIINTIIPLQFVYQKYIGKLEIENIIEMIKQIKSEKNSIIDKFKTINIDSINAFETQALLQLKKEYCNKSKCLQCAIGNAILSKKI